jgi:hypothetical protein
MYRRVTYPAMGRGAERTGNHDPDALLARIQAKVLKTSLARLTMCVQNVERAIRPRLGKNSFATHRGWWR